MNWLAGHHGYRTKANNRSISLFAIMSYESTHEVDFISWPNIQRNHILLREKNIG